MVRDVVKKLVSLVMSYRMTYAVCQELGQEMDSEGIGHCPRFILPFTAKQPDGTFSPIPGCTANCHVSGRDKKLPPCEQPLLVSAKPFKISYLRKPFQPCLQESSCLSLYEPGRGAKVN